VNRSAFLAVAVAISLHATGCAAMFKGTKDTVVFQAADGAATAYALNGVPLGNGAAVAATVSTKGNAKATVTATRAGCDPVTSPLRTSFAPVSLLGLFWDFGIISMGLVDGLGTGAAVRTDEVQVVTPSCPQ
jgi:hypothetical protein